MRKTAFTFELKTIAACLSVSAAGKDPWEVGDYVNGALHEGCTATNETILTLRNLTRIAQQGQGRRLIYQCHGTGSHDSIAAFLVGAGEVCDDEDTPPPPPRPSLLVIFQ